MPHKINIRVVFHFQEVLPVIEFGNIPEYSSRNFHCVQQGHISRGAIRLIGGGYRFPFIHANNKKKILSPGNFHLLIYHARLRYSLPGNTFAYRPGNYPAPADNYSWFAP